MIPQLAGLAQRIEDISEGLVQGLAMQLHVVFGAQLPHSCGDFVEIVSWHRREEMVLYLVVQMPRKPICERSRLHIACRDQLLIHPISLLVFLNGHRKMIHLCHPQEPMRFKDAGEKIELKETPQAAGERSKHQIHS